MNAACVINGRFRKQPMTGVQRVAAALSSRLSIAHRFATPEAGGSAARGHLWEQGVLPFLTHGELLWSPCVTGPLAVRRQVVTVHDAAVFEHPEWFSASFARLYRFIVPRLCRRVLKIVTVSSYSRSRLCALLGLEARHIEVVYNASDAAFHPRSEREIHAVRQRHGLDDARYFMTLSTLEPRKNLALVLRAWDQAKGRLPPNTRLLVVGQAGPSRVFRGSPLSAPGLTDVLYAGYVPEADLPALLSGSRALLYPSLYEGFGLPVIEAMACGTPVVTTRLTCLPEIAAKAAMYVDAVDESQMCKSLIALANSDDGRQEYAALGLARASQYSWTASASKMNQILESLA